MTRDMAMESTHMQMETPIRENGLTTIGLFHSCSDVSGHPMTLKCKDYFQSMADHSKSSATG